MQNLILAFQENYYLFFLGTLKTIFIWLICSFFSLTFGSFFAFFQIKKFNKLIFFKQISKFFSILTFILRGVPFYVQILFYYFVIPEFLNLKFSPFFAGVISLGICSAAYTSEIILAGINSIENNQWENSYIFGYNLFQQLFYIIIPQTLKKIFPILLNEFNMILKSTSTLSVIGTIELTRLSQNIVSKTFNPIPVYTITALIYLLITTIFEILIKKFFIEKKEI